MSVLLLSGAGEARAVAAGLSEQGVSVMASFAGGERRLGELAVPVRVGGFGGEAGFRRFLSEEAVSAVLDVTHPFAEHISARTAGVCAELGMPFAMFQREPWPLEEGWVELAREEDAAAVIPEGAVVFLATGRKTLARFANLRKREVIARVLRAPGGAFPFDGGRFLYGEAPFSEASERTLFEALGVDWLVVKNAGGAGARAKLDAARALGVRVALIRRPAVPEGALVFSDVAAAVNWAAAYG